MSNLVGGQAGVRVAESELVFGVRTPAPQGVVESYPAGVESTGSDQQPVVRVTNLGRDTAIRRAAETELAKPVGTPAPQAVIQPRAAGVVKAKLRRIPFGNDADL